MAQSLSSEELVHEAACGMIREFLKRKNLSAVAEIFDSEQVSMSSIYASGGIVSVVRNVIFSTRLICILAKHSHGRRVLLSLKKRS